MTLLALLAAMCVGVSIGTPIGYIVSRKVRARRVRRSVADLLGWMRQNAEIARNITVPDCPCPRCTAARGTKNVTN